MCDAHYMREYRGNKSDSPLRFRTKRSTNIEDHKNRILSNVKVDSTTGCWNWTAGLSYRGYGNAKGIVDGVEYNSSHRLSYAVFVGRVPKFESVHHTCANTACCNPDHLQPVSQRENTAEWRLRSAYEKRVKDLEERLKNCTCQENA